MIAASSPFKILSDTEGEFGAHSLEFSTPATLRLCRGFPAEVKKLSFMVPEFTFLKKKKRTCLGPYITAVAVVTHTKFRYFLKYLSNKTGDYEPKTKKKKKKHSNF